LEQDDQQCHMDGNASGRNSPGDVSLEFQNGKKIVGSSKMQLRWKLLKWK